MWGSANFAPLKTFVKGLGENYDNYVPAQLARTDYVFIFESDVSEAIKGLERIQCASTNNLLLISPLFSELLNGKIGRLKDTKRFRDDHGYTKAMLKDKLDPRKAPKDKLPKKWIDNELFFNAPEVMVTNNLVVSVSPLKTAAPSPSLMAKTEKELKLIICGDNTPIIERKAAVRALVSQRRAVGLQEVAKGLYEAELLYTYNDTADEVVRAGSAAVPVILGLLNDPAQRISQKNL